MKLNGKFAKGFLFLITAVLVFPSVSFAASSFQPLTSIYSTDKDGLLTPEGVACSAALQEIVAADTGHGRLMRYTFKDGKVKDEKEIKLPEIAQPRKVQLNSKGEIFVLDGKKHAIARLSADGKFEGWLAPSGMPDAAAIMPKSFKIGPDDNIYILDIMGERVVILGPGGKFIKQIAFPAGYVFMADVTVDGTGRIIIADSAKAVLYAATKDAAAFTPLTGDLHKYIDLPSNITADKNGTIYIVDQNGGRVILVGQDGVFQGRRVNLGWNEGLLYFPSQLCLESDGYAVIADRENNRIQIFRILESGS